MLSNTVRVTWVLWFISSRALSTTCTTGTARCKLFVDAASAGDPVDDLICDGCSDELGSTPLMHAAYHNHVDVIRACLSAGADVNQRAIDGVTALMLASKCKHCKTEEQLATLKLLLAANASVDLPNLKLETPLMLAAKRGHAEAVELLLQHGARADLRDFRGVTALMVAASQGHGDVVEKLLRCNPRPSLYFDPDSDSCTLYSMDSAGLTAREWAAGQGHPEVLKLLPETPLHVWFNRMLRSTEFWGLVVLVSLVSVASGCVHGLCHSPKKAPVPSRGEQMLAVCHMWGCRRRLAHIYRFLEVFSITVVPIQFMYEVHWLVVLPTYLALLLIPAYVRYGTLYPPCRIFASAPPLRTAKWTQTDVGWLVFGVLRVGFFFLLAWITHESDEKVNSFWEGLTHHTMREKGLAEPPSWRYAAAAVTNRASEEAVDLLVHNPASRVCFFSRCAHTFPVDVLWSCCTRGGTILLMIWVAWVLLILLSALPFSRRRDITGCEHDESEILAVAKAIQEAANDGREVVAEVVAYDDRRIEPIRVWSPCSGVLWVLFFVVLDVGLDLNTVATLLYHEDWRFATCILGSCLFTTMSEISSGRITEVLKSLSKMEKRGVWEDAFFQLLSMERNFESSVNLLLLSYALPFAAKTPYQVVCAAISLLSSTLALCSEVHERVDLQVVDPKHDDAL